MTALSLLSRQTFLRSLLALIGCCLVLAGCVTVESESRKAVTYANSVLPEPFEIFDTQGVHPFGSSLTVYVYLRGRRDSALQWEMTWEPDRLNGGNDPASVLKQYQQGQAYLRASQKLYDILHADPALPPLQVRVWLDKTSRDNSGSPMIFIYGDLTNDNRMPMMRALYQGITLWRRQFIADAVSTTLLGTPTLDNFAFGIYFLPPPRLPDSSDFLNIHLIPPHSPEFNSARYSISTSWQRISDPQSLSKNLYPYDWRPDKKQWEADAVAAAQTYADEHPELGLAADYRTWPPDKPLPDDLDVMRYYVGFCPIADRTFDKAGKPNGCSGRIKTALAFNYRISERRAFDFKILHITKYPVMLEELDAQTDNPRPSGK